MSLSVTLSGYYVFENRRSKYYQSKLRLPKEVTTERPLERHDKTKQALDISHWSEGSWNPEQKLVRTTTFKE
jgi:hypothetical protein